MAVLLERGAVLGDVIVAEEASEIITRESRLVTNDEDHEITLVVGYPMNITSATAVTALLAAAVGNCDSLLLQGITLDAGESHLVPLLNVGPAAVNEDQLPTEDYEGDAITMATFKSAVAALPLVKLRKEPPQQLTQET